MLSIFYIWEKYEFLNLFRISAKSGDGKVILSHSQGEPYSFIFGKSEVSNIVLDIFIFFYFLDPHYPHVCFK